MEEGPSVDPSLKFETDPLLRVLEALNQVLRQMIFRFPSVFARTVVKPLYHF